VFSGQSYDFKSEFVKVKSIRTIRILGLAEGKNMDRPGFLVEFILSWSAAKNCHQDQKQRSPGPIRVTGPTMSLLTSSTSQMNQFRI
jgi:hypothetical protein